MTPGTGRVYNLNNPKAGTARRMTCEDRKIMLVMFTTARRITFATGMAVGLTVGTLLGAGLSHAAPSTPSCVDDGLRICLPGNVDHKPAGCYDDGGVLVALWPCYVVVSPNGTGAVYV